MGWLFLFTGEKDREPENVKRRDCQDHQQAGKQVEASADNRRDRVHEPGAAAAVADAVWQLYKRPARLWAGQGLYGVEYSDGVTL